ncbi:MAG: hypothetical protein KGL39_48730 [Patescibacteria group bacterium]|nr:hypothetical protein [Patescibacteria group bacterium]
MFQLIKHITMTARSRECVDYSEYRDNSYLAMGCDCRICREVREVWAQLGNPL